MRFRAAEAADADDLAALHADSWRRHYRGAYADSFLDGDVLADRQATWRRRLQTPDRPSHTIVAVDDGDLVAFAHVVFDDDETYGSLLDNLHVVKGRQRSGIGALLVSHVASAVVERAASARLYLWVLEQNVSAQAFYERIGGVRMERVPLDPPGGVAARLNGAPAKLRYVWPDATDLL